MIETTNGHMTADQIKRIRARLGYTQERLAAAIGVSVRTVMNWEQGNGWPNAENADRITLLDTDAMRRKEEMRSVLKTAQELAKRNVVVSAAVDDDDALASVYAEVDYKLGTLINLLELA